MARNLFNRTTEDYQVITLTPAAYTADDVIGGRLTVNPGIQGGGGVLCNVDLFDLDNVKAAAKLYLFKSEPGADGPTVIADNAVISAITDDDLMELVGIIDIGASDYQEIVTAGGTRAFAQVEANLKFRCPGGIIYAYLTCTGTPTYTTATALRLRLTFWAD